MSLELSNFSVRSEFSIDPYIVSLCPPLIISFTPFPHTSPQLELSPLQVAILGMQEKISSLRKCLLQRPTDSKLLQMLLQGGIATAVNQGPFAIAKCFLDIPLREQSHDHRRLRVCFKEFTRRSAE